MQLSADILDVVWVVQAWPCCPRDPLPRRLQMSLQQFIVFFQDPPVVIGFIAALCATLLQNAFKAVYRVCKVLK